MVCSEPHTHPHRILLLVTGRPPQVVTETLYALCVSREPAFIPTEVHLITTSEGAQDARLALLSEPDGWFHRLCRDYQSNRR
jgi:CRISPR-associated protein (TIGR02584 family)